MKIEEIKDKYAKLVKCDNWAKFVLNSEKSELLMALNVISQEYAQQRVNEVKENYIECFEKFIPIEKWDEATEFLSTDKGHLPEDFLTRNGS